MSKQPTSPVQPKHTHYVSMDNHAIYPAMTSPAGYEDEHPSEWRPATSAEVSKYESGAKELVVEPLSLNVVETLAAAAEAAPTPTEIKLADEDEPVEVKPDLPPPPPAPAFTKK